MKLNSKSINYNVQTVDELLSLDGLEGDTVVVTDENRGGVFVYREDNVGTNNGGTIFNGWNRQYDGAVNVKWFGAVGNWDGVDGADDTLSVLLCISYATLNNVKTIYFPKGNYKVEEPIELSGGITVFGDGIATTGITRTSLAGKIIDNNTIFGIFYLTGGWNNISNLSINGVSVSSGIQFGYNIPAKSSIKNIAINNCLKGIEEVSGVFLTEINNVQAVNCDVGFDFSSDSQCTSLTLTSCYAANCGTGYSFKQVDYSNLTSCAADNCNWGSLPNNAWGNGKGSPDSSSGIYHFVQCSGINLDNCGAEGSYGNGAISTVNSWLTIASLSVIYCKSTFIPPTSIYAVGPIQGSAAANIVTILNPRINSWENTAIPVGQPVAGLIACNYDEPVFGASQTTQFTVSGGAESSTLFAGPYASKYCVSLNYVRDKGARAGLSTPITLTAYVPTKVIFDNTSYQTDGIYSSGNFTAPIKGLYIISSQIHYRSGISNTGDVTIQLYVNGNPYSDGQSDSNIGVGSNGDIRATITDILNLSEGDTVSVYAISATGGVLVNVNAWTWCSFAKV